MLEIAKSKVPGQAATMGAGALLKVARGGGGLTPVGLAIAAGAFVGQVAWEDRDWYVNRGGRREYVDENDRVVSEDIKGHPEIVFEQTLEPADGQGDGTVPISPPTALPPKSAYHHPDT